MTSLPEAHAEYFLFFSFLFFFFLNEQEAEAPGLASLFFLVDERKERRTRPYKEPKASSPSPGGPGLLPSGGWRGAAGRAGRARGPGRCALRRPLSSARTAARSSRSCRLGVAEARRRG